MNLLIPMEALRKYMNRLSYFHWSKTYLPESSPCRLCGIYSPVLYCDCVSYDTQNVSQLSDPDQVTFQEVQKLLILNKSKETVEHLCNELDELKKNEEYVFFFIMLFIATTRSTDQCLSIMSIASTALLNSNIYCALLRITYYVWRNSEPMPIKSRQNS